MSGLLPTGTNSQWFVEGLKHFHRNTRTTGKFKEMADQKANKGTSRLKKGLLDFFAPEQPAQPAQPQQPTQVQQPASQPPQPSPVVNRTASNIMQGKVGVVNQQMRSQLLDAIASANKQGLDFFEFNKALEKDGTVREEEKYRKVFDFMRAMAHDESSLKHTLLESGKFYMEVLDKEKQTMEVEFVELEKDRIGTKRSDIERGIKDMEDLNTQIQELQKKLQETKASVAELQDQVSSDEIALQRQRMDFNVTFDELYLEYQTKLKNIETFIPDPTAVETETKQ